MKYLAMAFSIMVLFSATSNAQTEYKKKTKVKIEGAYPATSSSSVHSESSHAAMGTTHHAAYHATGTRMHRTATRSYRAHRKHYAHKTSKAHHYKKIKRVHTKHGYKIKYKS